MKVDLFDRPKVTGPPPQCVSCSRFVAVHDPGTARHLERGDYGTVYSCEFECARCVAKSKAEREAL